MVLKSIKANAALFILLLILFAILLFVPVISWKYPLAFLCSLTLFIIIYSDKLLGINIGDIDLLSAAINSPESYAKSLKDIYGINIKVQENNGNKVDLFAK